MKLKRITKREARKLWDAGEEVILCGCKMRPGPPWHPEFHLQPDGFRNFDTAYRAWAFYNTSYEEGYYAHYYVQDSVLPNLTTHLGDVVLGVARQY